MNRNEHSLSRRDVIRGTGATALGATLAGCQNRDRGAVSVDTRFEVVDRADQRTLQLRLSFQSPDDIYRAVVMLNGSRIELFEDVTESIELDIPVTGGRQYTAEIIAPTSKTDISPFREEIDVGFVPQTDVPLHGDRTLCAHYYPWYGQSDETENWTGSSPSTPLLGGYRSRETNTIEQHLDWCEQARIDWLSASWWGPGSFTDETLLEHVFEVERAREFTWSVLYETIGRFDSVPVDMDTESARERLRSDLVYLENNYFGKPWYHTIEGRPVLYVFVAFQLTGAVAGAWEEAVEQLDVDPYLIADIGNNAIPDVLPVVEVADAITTYNPYEVRDDISDVFREETETRYRRWFLGREAADIDVMPTAIPGYNDTLIRDNPVLETDHELYDWCVRTARKYATGHDTVFITSFNEWFEDTQIEPSESTEETFLDVTGDIFDADTYNYPNFDGDILTLEFGEATPEDALTGREGSGRTLTFLCEQLTLTDLKGETIDSYDIGGPNDALVLSGAYTPQTDRDAHARWFGGGTTTTLYLKDVLPKYTVQLSGRASTETQVTAYLYGEEIGSADVGQAVDTYELTK